MILKNLKEEIISGYLVTEKQKKICCIELEILQEFMRVCSKNGLKFFVAHGTLLGAARHKGFIPWDDDIDVNMPREDYERLKRIAGEEFSPPFFFQTFESDDKIFFGHGKLRHSLSTGIDVQDIFNTRNGTANNGLYIDVFPMDGIVENEHERKLQSEKIEFYRGLLLAKIYGDGSWEFYQYPHELWTKYKKLCEEYTKEELYQCFESWVSKYSYEPTARTGIISYVTDYECCYWYREDYERLDILPFEHLDVPVPSNWHRCLQIKWGDYMKFPSLESRGKKHSEVIMDAEIPYNKKDFSAYHWTVSMLEGSPISLFGAGATAKKFIDLYGSRFEICRVCDNDKTLWGEAWNGFRISSPSEMKKSDCICMIVSQSYQEIESQLQMMGVKRFYIFLPWRIY